MAPSMAQPGGRGGGRGPGWHRGVCCEWARWRPRRPGLGAGEGEGEGGARQGARQGGRQGIPHATGRRPSPAPQPTRRRSSVPTGCAVTPLTHVQAEAHGHLVVGQPRVQVLAARRGVAGGRGRGVWSGRWRQAGGFADAGEEPPNCCWPARGTPHSRCARAPGPPPGAPRAEAAQLGGALEGGLDDDEGGQGLAGVAGGGAGEDGTGANRRRAVQVLTCCPASALTTSIGASQPAHSSTPPSTTHLVRHVDVLSLPQAVLPHQRAQPGWGQGRGARGAAGRATGPVSSKAGTGRCARSTQPLAGGQRSLRALVATAAAAHPRRRARCCTWSCARSAPRWWCCARCRWCPGCGCGPGWRRPRRGPPGR